MHSNSFPELDAPGLKARPSKANPKRLYWVARSDLARAGYEPETVRLHYDISNPLDRRLIEQACKIHQSEMLAWAAGARSGAKPFDGTIASLIHQFQTHEASPYHDLKWNTRRNDDQVLRVLAKAIGKRSLASIGLTDLRRWYDEAKRPKAEGKPERIRKAHGIIKMLRRLFAFGKSAEIAGSARLVSILEETRFKQPPRRRAKLERHHVEAFIPVALTAGRLSLAIGTAAQFETMMRQRDVIGEWQPIGRSEDGGGIVVRGRRWANGLTWQDLQDDFVLRKHTTKTGALVAHDLKLCPLTFGLLSRIPGEKRVGPVIVDETAGRPYAEHAYSREWRRIARRAGIPDEIWNMDARAGAITEAEDAGADLDSIRSAAGHTQASTTSRYSRGPIGKSRGVATLRQAHLTSKNSE